MNCISEVRDRLVAFLRTELKIHCTEISKAQWQSLPLAPAYRFGWMPPVNLTDAVDDDQLIVMFSPELLSEVVAALEPDTADAYLTTVEAVISHYVSRRGAPVDVIERELETLFFDEAPYAMQVRSEVEFRALDAGIVPVSD